MRFPWAVSPSSDQGAPGSLSRGRPSIQRLLGWLATGFILISGSLVAVTLAHVRADAFESEERLSGSFADIIAEQTSLTLQAIDQSLELTSHRLAEARAAGDLREPEGSELLRARIKATPFVRAVWVLDAEGRVIHDSDQGNLGLDLSDRAYFQIYHKEPQTVFYVGSPVRSRTTGAWMINGARPLRSAQGALEGVLVAAFEPTYFDNLWGRVDLGAGGSIALFRVDGVLMTRTPHDDAVMGKTFRNQPLFGALPTNPAGTFHDTSPIDGEVRVLSYRTLSSYPDLVVVVGQSYELVLAPWRRLAAAAFSIWGAASLAIIILCLFLNQAWQRGLLSEAEVRQMAERRRKSEDMLRSVLEHVPARIFWKGRDLRYLGANTLFARQAGCKDPDELTGKTDLEMRWRDQAEAYRADDLAVMESGQPKLDYEQKVTTPDGQGIWLNTSKVPLRDAQDQVVGVLGIDQDITERKRSANALTAAVREKDALLREVHHRLKNNLALITSLMRLEAGKSREPETKSALKAMQTRIHSVILLNETLYKTQHYSRINLSEYLGQMATHLFRAQNPDPDAVRLVLELDPVEVDTDQAIPCGLIVNELITNSLKYAFPGERRGEVRVGLTHERYGPARLCVSDTGVGLPPDFEEKRGRSLGLQLVSDLAKQLQGDLVVGPGPTFAVTFLPRLDRGTIEIPPLAVIRR